MIAWALIALCLTYVALYVTLRLMPEPRKPKGLAPIQVIAWRRHVYVEAPTDAAAVDAFLAADLDLAERGQ